MTALGIFMSATETNRGGESVWGGSECIQNVHKGIHSITGQWESNYSRLKLLPVKLWQAQALLLTSWISTAVTGLWFSSCSFSALVKAQWKKMHITAWFEDPPMPAVMQTHSWALRDEMSLPGIILAGLALWLKGHHLGIWTIWGLSCAQPCCCWHLQPRRASRDL